MKLLTGIRYVLAGVLVYGLLPLLLLAVCEGMDAVSLTDILSLWKEFGLIAVYFALSWYEGRLRKQRGLPGFYDLFNLKGLTLLIWICFGVALFFAFLLLLGADFLRMSDYGGQMLDDLFVTESDAEGYLFLGFLMAYPSALVLSPLLPLLAGASIHLYKRKRLLRMSGPDA